MKHSLRMIAGLISVLVVIALSGCGSTVPARVIATAPVGQNPIAVDVNPATNRIYVLNQCCSPGSVSVIDGLTNSVVGTVPVGGSPCQVAVNSNTNTIYVTNSADQSVTVIDGATNATTTVGIGSQPCALAVNSATNKTYVATEAGVTVIDGANNTTQSVALAGYATHIAVNSMTNQVYISVGSAPEANVTVLDGATNQILKTFPGGEFTPESIAVNTIANEAYVLENFYHASGAVIIDGATLQTSGVLGPDQLTDQLGAPSDTIGANAKTNRVYLLYPDSFYEFDRATKNITVRLPILGTALKVEDAISQIYVLATDAPGSVIVIDGTSYATITLQADIYPSALALNSATHRAYITNRCGQ